MVTSYKEDVSRAKIHRNPTHCIQACYNTLGTVATCPTLWNVAYQIFPLFNAYSGG